MKTIQMTIDERLLEELDCAARAERRSRSEFIREAVQTSLRQRNVRELVRQHEAGYRAHPVEPGEFDLFDDEFEWEDL